MRLQCIHTHKFHGNLNGLQVRNVFGQSALNALRPTNIRRGVSFPGGFAGFLIPLVIECKSWRAISLADIFPFSGGGDLVKAKVHVV